MLMGPADGQVANVICLNNVKQSYTKEKKNRVLKMSFKALSSNKKWNNLGISDLMMRNRKMKCLWRIFPYFFNEYSIQSLFHHLM